MSELHITASLEGVDGKRYECQLRLNAEQCGDSTFRGRVIQQWAHSLICSLESLDAAFAASRLAATQTGVMK